MCLGRNRCVCEWFPVNIGIRHGCVMSAQIFNSFMEVLEVNAMELWKGMKLMHVNGSWFDKKNLLFADGTALLADAQEKLCRLMGKFARICQRRNWE